MIVITEKMRRAITKKQREGIKAALARNPKPFVKVRLLETVAGRVLTYRKGKIMRGRRLRSGWQLVPIPTPQHMISVMICVPNSAVEIL